MSEVNIIIRTADKTRKIGAPAKLNQTGYDVLQSAVDEWSLSTDTDYNLVNISSNKTINLKSSLADNNINDGDILEIQPVLVAG